MKTKIKKLDFYKEPEEAFYPYRNEKYAVFLDSSMKNEQGRYSVIALKPYLYSGGEKWSVQNKRKHFP